MDEKDTGGKTGNEGRAGNNADDKAADEIRRLQKHMIRCFDDAGTNVEDMPLPDHPRYSSDKAHIIKDPELVVEPETSPARYLALFFAILACVTLAVVLPRYGSRPVSPGAIDTARVAEPPAPDADAISETSKKTRNPDVERSLKMIEREQKRKDEGRKHLEPVWKPSKLSQNIFKMELVPGRSKVKYVQVRYPDCYGIKPHSFNAPSKEYESDHFMLFRPEIKPSSRCSGYITINSDSSEITPVFIETVLDIELTCFENNEKSICCSHRKSNSCSEDRDSFFKGRKKARATSWGLYHLTSQEDPETGELKFVSLNFANQMSLEISAPLPDSEFRTRVVFPDNDNPSFTFSSPPDCTSNEGLYENLSWEYELNYIPGVPIPSIDLVNTSSEIDSSIFEDTKPIILESFIPLGLPENHNTSYKARFACHCGVNPECEITQVQLNRQM